MPIATNPKTGEVFFLDEDSQWKPAKIAVNPETKEALAFDGKAWKSLPVSKGIIDYVEDAARSVASGATFEYSDEILAGISTLFGKGTYEENLKKQQTREAQIPAGIKIPGQIAGAVGATIAAAPLAAAAIPARVLQAIQALPRTLQFAGLGAAEGALAGSGAAEQGDRAGGALTGALIGAPVGAAAPSVVRGVTAVGRGIRGAFSPEAGAAADIGRAIVRDETTPAALAGRFAGAQAERPGVATLADAAGENLRGLLERVAQTPGAGRTQVIPALTARQQQQATRIADDLKALTGTNKTAIQTIEETMEARATEAAPLYERAMAFDAKQVPEIVNAFGNAIKTGWGAAIVKNPSFRRTLETEHGIDPKNIQNMPVMVLVDAFKKETDGLIGEAMRKGNDNQARVLSKMRDDLMGIVDKFNPDYATARKAWAGKSAYLDAVEDGRTILGKNVSAEELATRISALSDADKEAYRIGAVSAIINRMGSDPAKLGDMTKYLRSPEMTKKIAAMMPTPAAAASWLKRLEFEVSSSELTARALGNSATARRLAERQDAEGIVGDLVMEAILSGPSGLSIFNRMMNYGTGIFRDTLRSRTDKLLGDLLTNPARGGDVANILQRGTVTVRPMGNVAPAAATAGTVNAVQ